MKKQITSKQYLAKLHYEINHSVSFNTFIKSLRYSIAINHEYIMSAVDYDEMVLDLIQLGELDIEVLSKIKMKKKDDE